MNFEWQLICLLGQLTVNNATATASYALPILYSSYKDSVKDGWEDLKFFSSL